ncbi:MAG: hypothetical protein K2O00_02735 [Muribaculaceae bacterium]|nr:hypothetical protein [Muribaculaceae bacterium]
MSKAGLKKELKQLDKDELIEVILDIYSLRKDAKEYFEYYINPDVDKLFRKYEDKIFKELKRVKKRFWRKETAARPSVIKRAIKEFESFGSGKEWTVKLMFSTVENALHISSDTQPTVKHADAISNILQECMLSANECGCFKEYAERILILTKLDDSGVGDIALRKRFLRALHAIDMRTEYFHQLPPDEYYKKTLTGL